MKVKIGETIYDSENEPLMVILSTADKENIGNMAPEATCYASFPDCWGSEDKMRAWMLTPNDRVEGRDAALSRRVPSHDGLGGAVSPAPTFKGEDDGH